MWWNITITLLTSQTLIQNTNGVVTNDPMMKTIGHECYNWSKDTLVEWWQVS
jgi:hypothetical protein